jgi:hypothetical protein
MYLRTQPYDSNMQESSSFVYNKNNILLCIIFSLVMIYIFTIVALLSEYIDITNKIKNKKMYKKTTHDYEYKFVYEYRTNAFPNIINKKIVRRIPDKIPISIKMSSLQSPF